MTLNESIIAAVTPVIPVCVPDIYRGEAEEYCTFNYSELPEGFGDDMPTLSRCAVQLHYYCPEGRDSQKARRALKLAILEADFTAPEITNASDKDGQHFVFEFEALGGV